jgi:FLVCR family feline leukemia virus subgroup C receptor-related protein
MAVGFEMGSEITYPQPEGTTAGIVVLGTQILSVFHAMAYSWMVHGIGDFWANIILTVTLLIGTGLTLMMPSDLRRKTAHNSSVHRA